MIQHLYLHIPFCHKICPFCAFAVRRDRPSEHGFYLDCLRREGELRYQQLDENLGILETIYLGGGTPSCLSADEVHALFDWIHQRFQLSPHCQITFETNPEDISKSYLETLHSVGVNRVSLGIQSFQAKHLKTLGRNHSPSQAQQALNQIHQAGFTDWNADLIFGFYQHSLDSFQQDLDLLLSYSIPHISLYCLELETLSRFSKQPHMRQWSEEQTDFQQSLYLFGVNRLKQQGIEQYEVSNFAKPGHCGKTNLAIWSGKSYLGLGVGAHSFHGGKRWANHRSLKDYQETLSLQKFPVVFEETLSPVQSSNEWLMLQLRRVTGLHMAEMEIQFGFRWSSQQLQWVELWVNKGYAHWDGPHLQLTTAGLFLADGMSSQLFR